MIRAVSPSVTRSTESLSSKLCRRHLQQYLTASLSISAYATTSSSSPSFACTSTINRPICTSHYATINLTSGRSISSSSSLLMNRNTPANQSHHHHNQHLPPVDVDSPAYNVNLSTTWKGVGTRFDPNSSTPESRILAAALDFVPAHGWTLQSIEQGAKSLGYSSVAHGLFPRGGVELVEYFVRRTTGEVREEMEKMGKEKLNGMKVTAKVRLGVTLRLEKLKPYVGKWAEALALMAQPQNVPTALENLAEVVDEIWYMAGDRSFDMNYYSKRALLAGVYSSTELYMTQDKTPDFSGTIEFLDRRLGDVAFLGRTVSEVNNVVSFGVRSAFGILASRGIRLPFQK
ncbi:Ubiquinone biosynthesis protein coq9, mitochondrial [Blyttiomyces sp. JEL0837]|nr:Ubiquinone biosynthesis protein coq9, mitochondrial [Blyttiomyces sp. JEL0837]